MKKILLLLCLISLSSVFAQNQESINLEIESLNYGNIILDSLEVAGVIVTEDYDESLPQVRIDASFDGRLCIISINKTSQLGPMRISSTSTTKKEKKCVKRIQKFIKKNSSSLVFSLGW